MDSRSFLEYVTDSVFSSSTLGGIISVGTQLGLDAIGVPGWIGSFLPNLLNQITLGLGGNSDPQTADENILNRIWNNISKFGSGLWGAIGDVVSLGADILKQGYEAVRNTFGSLFSREVQETLYEAATAGPIGAGAGWALSSRTENYDANDNLTSVVEIFSNTAGDRTTIVTGVQTGNYTIQREMANGNWFQEVYEGVTRGAQGGFGFSSVAFAQETPDGIRIDQTIYDSDDYTVSLSDAVSGYDLYEYQIADGEIASFEQSLQAFAYGNDVSRLRAANPQDIVLADLGGFQLSQLEGLNYTVNFNHNTGETSISIPVASETNTQFLSQIQSILQQTGQNIQQYTEKIKNGFALLGSRTDAEIAQHKAAEISEVLSDPGKIYVIHTQTDSRTSYLTRQATRLGTSDYSVNHSALAFKDKDGKVFIIEIQMDGHAQSGLNTDVLVRPFEEWAAPYIDIDAQPLPISAEQADAFRQNVIFGKYVNESTMTPKIQLYYDFPGALVGEGAGIPIPGQGSKKFCSELVADLIFEGFGREIQPLDNDSYVSPNELQRRIEEWIASQQGSNEGKS